MTELQEKFETKALPKEELLALCKAAGIKGELELAQAAGQTIDYKEASSKIVRAVVPAKKGAKKGKGKGKGKKKKK